MADGVLYSTITTNREADCFRLGSIRLAKFGSATSFTRCGGRVHQHSVLGVQLLFRKYMACLDHTICCFPPAPLPTQKKALLFTYVCLAVSHP